MPKPYIYPVNRRHLPHNVGEKNQNLQFLYKKGFAIPLTYAISWDLQTVFERENGQIPGNFSAALSEVLDPQKAYAVRSSSSVEDTQLQSYAGQFLSVLDVRGLKSVLDAIQAVWDSSDLEGPTSYRSHHGENQANIHMGVTLQEMIPAKHSGVAFSRNPITGSDEVVIEAVEGSGVALVQGGITPKRWIWKWGKWLQTPENSDIPIDLIQEIVSGVRAISTAYGSPVDVEWVFDGSQVTWLQLRAITAMQGIDIYANHIPKEFLPGVIKPLVWTVNVPLVNGAWVRMLTELIGENQLDPLRLARAFYGHAYFNMGLLGTVFQKLGLPDNALERLMGFESEGENGPSFRPSLKVVRYMPGMLKFSVEKVWFGRKLERYLQQAERSYADLAALDVNALKMTEILDYLEQLYLLNQNTAYFNIVTPLLMRLYHSLAKRSLMRRGTIYETVNWLEGWPERIEYNPVYHLRILGALYNNLKSTEQQALLSSQPDVGTERALSFKKKLSAFNQRFGHLSDSGNDFSYPSWQETPGLVLSMIAGFADTPSQDKSERDTKSGSPIVFDRFLLQRACRYSRYREQISYLFTRGQSMFRYGYQRLGTSFCALGWLENPDDIFFLEHNEIVHVVQNTNSGSSLPDLVKERKRDHTRFKEVTLPPVIYGDHPPPIIDPSSKTFSGIPTSRGVHRGAVRVVQGISDFPKVTDGCVLVIAYSDVSWTPLFARAGAVLAEAGGMLSHSSIVAREYGIPAVVSVSNITTLKDGSDVTVNGYTGDIIVHE